MAKCPTCGAGGDLVQRVVRVGLTHEVVTECADKIACWFRWDVAHGLAGPEQHNSRLAVNEPAVA